MKRPTIYDVAERAGVSKSLVSLVLRDSPRVSDAKRAAVLAAMADLDYTPSRLAAGLAGTRTRSVGVVIDDFANLWFVEALAGLREALAREGYALSVADARLNAHLDIDPLEAFRSLRVDGVVLAGEASEAALARVGVPTVVLGTRAIVTPEAPVIASDEVAGGRLATRHLISLGHRDIVCVSGPGASATARERGFREAMADAGLEARVSHAAENTEAAAREVVAGVVARRGAGAGAGGAAGSGPSAVFAVNDIMAVGVMGAARDAGLSVPSDLSVVGYDDSPLAEYGIVSLTSVSGDPAELGEAAGAALLALLDAAPEYAATEGAVPEGAVHGDDAATEPAPTTRLFPPRLRVRSSTAPPPSPPTP